MEKRLLELNALVDTHVFGRSVSWQWCMLEWNPSGEDWWQSAEEYLDWIAKKLPPHNKISAHPQYYGNDWSLQVTVDKDWRDHPEDYHLEWLPCPEEMDDAGRPFFFCPCPFYSTEIQEAWKIVEEMAPEYGLYLRRREEELWEASFTPGKVTTSLTAPEAICAAALLVKGPITIKLD